MRFLKFGPGVAGDDEFLIGRDHADFDLRGRFGNNGFGRAGGGVEFGVEFEPAEIEVCADGGSEAWAVLADAGGEHEGVATAELDELGITLDPVRNEALRGAEGEISAAGSRAKILVIPANEELVVARGTVRCLQAGR